MNQKELTKTFQIEKPFGLHGLYKVIQPYEGITFRERHNTSKLFTQRSFYKCIDLRPVM